MRPSAFALSSLLAGSVASLAAAQPSADLRGFRASIDPGAGVYLEPAATPDTGEWSASLWASYAYRPITLRDPASDEVRFDVIRHQVSADFAAGVGVARRLLLGVTLPVVLHQTGDAPTSDATRVLGDTWLPAQALGDLGLVGKLTLVQPTGGELGGFALALHERFTLPTGHEASFVGEGGVTNELRLLAEYRLIAFGAHAAAGLKLRADEARFGCEATPASAAGADPCPTVFGHELPFGLGLSFRPQILGVDPEGRATFFLEAHGHLPLSPIAPFENQETAALELGLAARYALGDVSLLAGVETALAGGVGTAPLRAVLSVAWSPRVHDADGDGVEDDADQCRELAEDRDGLQDGDGCPEGDADEDGIVDEEDRCPLQKEDEDGVDDEDGCPDP
ncbi:thrombospondin type 3 repeat-containing protein [Sorangium sp. So ce375]|uniref:thrombospondin type 3 repeat-containing protein n=1 Tax=Sorangium sp. So ce375 TaxID=3133306 RepID=UPI003F5C9AAB